MHSVNEDACPFSQQCVQESSRHYDLFRWVLFPLVSNNYSDSSRVLLSPAICRTASLLPREFRRRFVGWSIDYPPQVSRMETSIGRVFLKHYIPQTKLIVIGRGFFVTACVCGSPEGRKVRSYQRNALLGIKLNRQYTASHGIRQISAFANNVYHDGPIRIILETRDI